MRYSEICFNGCWVDRDGKIYQCDHINDIHHAEIAMRELGIDSEQGDWLKTAFDTMTMSVNFSRKMTEIQKKAVLKYLQNSRKTTVETYFIDSPDDIHSFYTFGRFFAKLSSMLS